MLGETLDPVEEDRLRREDPNERASRVLEFVSKVIRNLGGEFGFVVVSEKLQRVLRVSYRSRSNTRTGESLLATPRRTRVQGESLLQQCGLRR